MMDRSGMWVRIKEYSLVWHESENCEQDKVNLQFIGMKLLLFRRPIEKNKMVQTMNFAPYCEDNYLIKGTQIIPIEDKPDSDHIILENFSKNDYQFVGELFASGYKIYMEDGNHSR